MTKLDNMTLEAVRSMMENGDCTVEEALARVIDELARWNKWLNHGIIIVASQEQFPKGRTM